VAEGRLQGRVALVTGASRGLGAAVARAYAREGARLILVARTTGGLEEVDDSCRAQGAEPATLVPLDLTDGEAIDRLGAALHERHGRLDVLAACAGDLGTLTPLAHTKARTWNRVMAVNLTANFRLIRSLDPLLRASPAGRAIFVTSGVGRSPRAFWGAYAITKAALEMMARIYAEETQASSVRVNIVDPGRLRTAMRALAYPGEDPATLPHPDQVTETFVELAMPSCARHGEIVQAGPSLSRPAGEGAEAEPGEAEAGEG
jgi:NAD(P)-dependent dehydrogenase (short-subunit alcohol dehydrogenase family)